MARDMMSPAQWTSEWHSRRLLNKRDQIKRRLRQWALRDFSRMLGMLVDLGAKPKMDIVELGCAPGLILNELCLLRPAHNYTGIDYSPDGLAIADQLLRENKMEATLIHADIRTHEPVRKYDMVLSFGLIEHFNDPCEMLEIHKKFAARDGLVVASVPNLSNHYVKAALERFRPVDLETHNLDIMSEDALREAFVKSGFGDVRVGSAVGPLLPTPEGTRTLASRAYRVFSYAWNGSIRFIPPRRTWYGHYWGCGRP